MPADPVTGIPPVAETVFMLSLHCHKPVQSLANSIAATDVFTGGGNLYSVLAAGGDPYSVLAGREDLNGVLAALCLLFRHCTRFFRECRHGHHGKAEYKCQEQTQYSFLHKILL